MHRIWTSTLALLALCFAASSLAAGHAAAGVMDDLWRLSSGRTSPAKSGDGIDAVATYIKTLPVRPDQAVLAASASHEGHWRLVNRAGETVTAANPDELARALNLLAPGMTETAKARLALYLTDETVFQHRALIGQLPLADRYVMIAGAAYALRDVMPMTDPRFLAAFAEVPPRLVVGLQDRAKFDEVMSQLTKPLAKALIRIIALEPGGPAKLSASPLIDPTTKRAMTDAIDPDRLRHTMSSLSGQTAVLTGRVTGDVLVFKPSNGPERSLLLPDLTAAAEAADVNLIVLRSSSARQPGARNWLWQRVEVANLDSAIERSTLADFLSALGGETGTMFVDAAAFNAFRTQLTIGQIHPATLSMPSGNPISGVFNDILAEVTAKVPVQGIMAYMRSAARDRELSRRIIPGIPSWLQISYAAALVLGLIAWPVVSGWWQRVWPPEQRAEYGNAIGFQAAQIARRLAFFLLFLPLAGPFAYLWFAARSFPRLLRALFRDVRLRTLFARR